MLSRIGGFQLNRVRAPRRFNLVYMYDLARILVRNVRSTPKSSVQYPEKPELARISFWRFGLPSFRSWGNVTSHSEVLLDWAGDVRDAGLSCHRHHDIRNGTARLTQTSKRESCVRRCDYRHFAPSIVLFRLRLWWYRASVAQWHLYPSSTGNSHSSQLIDH